MLADVQHMDKAKADICTFTEAESLQDRLFTVRDNLSRLCMSMSNLITVLMFALCAGEKSLWSYHIL